jgi:transglutaminase-like putative cysteine protease
MMPRLAVFKHLPLANFTLLLGVLLVILPHLPRQPLWLVLLCLGAIFWRGLHDAGQLRLPNRWLRTALVIVSIGALLFSFRTLVGREAGTALLIMMLSLKLLEMRSGRDVAVVLFLSFFVIVTGFLFSQSIFVGAYMLLVVTILLTAMIGFQHHDQALHDPNRLKRDTGHAIRLLAQALPIALLLFVLFPRIPGPLWGLPEDDAGAKTGLSDEMAPGRISRLANSNEVAFRVQFDGSVPPPAKRYWRGLILWHYDGRTWRGGGAPNDRQAQLRIKTEGPPVNYMVTLEPHQRRWLFALDLPATIPPGARMTSAFQLIARQPVKESRRYHMQSYPEYELEADQGPDRERYTQIPATTAPKTRRLVKRLWTQAGSAHNYVQRVLDYFAQQPFYYSREAPLLFNDPVDEFLFDTREGFCEHYSSAFTVMMRLAGIPARVVTGYQGGEMNPLSNYMIIRQSDAHAWSEVWLAGEGWRRIDPTSAIPPSRIKLTADLVQRQPRARERIIRTQGWLDSSLRQAGFLWDAVNNRWNQWVIGYTQARQNALFSALGIPDISWRGLTLILAISVGGAILFVAVAVLRRPHRRTDPARRLYQRFVDHMARLGFDKPTHETPSQFCHRLANEQRQLARPVGIITRQYLQLRYAPLDQLQRRRLLRKLRQSVNKLRTTRR